MNQRRAYRLKKRYEENPNEENRMKLVKAQKPIDEEKIKKLQDIGFDFGPY